MALKLTGSALFLALLIFLAVVPTCRAEEPWTPDDFDWGAFKLAPKEQWNGLYINLTEYPLPLHANLVHNGRLDTIHDHQVLFVAFSVGLLWQALNVAVGIGSVATAIQGCVTTDGSQGSVAGCAFGIAGTILSIGTAYKAAKGAGWFASAANTWDQSGLEAISLNVFQKRAVEKRQELHEYLMSEVLRRSFGEPEFMGYVPETHRLGRRDDHGYVHPHAPIFRISHPKHGLMDIASRKHANFTRITATYANHGLEKRQSFQHERLSDHLFEGRFDESAAEADNHNPDFDAAGGFQQLEDAIQCYGAGTWQAGQVLSAQMYDNDAEETFGFASIGIFENNDADGSLQGFTPSGMPLPVPSC